MRTRPGRSQSRICCDYRGGGGLLTSRWKENCDYPAATIRGAALSERLSEARRLSHTEWSATIKRLFSDYSATIAERIPRQNFSKLSKNFSKTRSEFFQNRPEIRAVFCVAGEGLSRRRGLGSGWLGGLGGGRRPPLGGRDLPPAVIRVRRSGVLLLMLPC